MAHDHSESNIFLKISASGTCFQPLATSILKCLQVCYVHCKAHLHVKSYQMHTHYVTGYQVNTAYLTIQNTIRVSFRIINNNKLDHT